MHPGFKAILHLCQVAAGKRVPTWLVAGNGAVWQWPTMQQHLHTALASTCMRLTVATMYVQMDVFLQAKLYFHLNDFTVLSLTDDDDICEITVHT